MNSDDRRETLRAFGQEVTEVILKYLGVLNATEIVGALEIVKRLMIEAIGTSTSIRNDDEGERKQMINMSKQYLNSTKKKFRN